MREPCVYILSSGSNATLYIGVTSNLLTRLDQHRNSEAKGFSRRYGTSVLVWYERHPTMATAIQREKSLKRWPRAWKLELIEALNPTWEDLTSTLLEDGERWRQADEMA